MDDDNDDQGLRTDLGTHVEDARGYDPEASEEGLVDKVKNALGGDTDENDEEGLLGDADDDSDDEDLV